MKHQGSDMALILQTKGECLPPVYHSSTGTENVPFSFSLFLQKLIWKMFVFLFHCAHRFKILTWTLHSLSVCMTQTGAAWNGPCALDRGQMVDVSVWPGWLGPFSRRLLADSFQQWMLSISLLWGKETDGRIHGEKVGGGWGGVIHCHRAPSAGWFGNTHDFSATSCESSKRVPFSGHKTLIVLCLCIYRTSLLQISPSKCKLQIPRGKIGFKRKSVERVCPLWHHKVPVGEHWMQRQSRSHTSTEFSRR